MRVLLLCVMTSALLLGAALAAGGQGKLPPPEAEAVWKHITQASPYTSWGAWPDYQGVQRSRSPHGPMNRVYVNQAGLNSAKPPVAFGTIEVKAVQNTAGQVKEVLVQYKVKGFNPKAGDWFWARYSPQGRVQAAGKPAHCIRCHSVLDDNDYIMVHYFR